MQTALWGTLIFKNSTTRKEKKLPKALLTLVSPLTKMLATAVI
jgi:hypothetical protein